MPSEFRLPALGADMDDGTIVEWHVAPGSRVKRGDVVAVVETDKGAIDVEIFMDGVVREIVVAPGTRIPVGTVIATIDAEGAAPAPSPSPSPTPSPAPAGEGRGEGSSPSPPSTERLKVSPAARRRARELHVDVEALKGTGPGGAISVEDVERAQPSEKSGMREAIAAAMSRSKREIPHYYLSTTVDVTPATEWLAAHNATAPVAERLLFAALIVKSVALACRELEGFSGFHRDGHYEPSPAVHVGVAVALRGGGLVAPAIMDTADKPLAALMDDFRALVTRARAGRLRASELAAPTIILTSLGEASVDAVFPIIQPPQVAIVGAGAVVERPWVVGGQVVPRQVLTLSLGADHRVTDGRLGAQFLARIAARLQSPASL
ncbi:MAG TPA: dihydrolipoamide acetyltransferase family protein [Burkholderiaceae bacterium]|nr:dihydrolipoamide acetyltransferase family protein [Burkholderiaceae bacterium]